MSTYIPIGGAADLHLPGPPEVPAQNQGLEEQLAYWKRRLAGCPEVLALPTDRPRPTHPTFRSAHETLRLHPSLIDKLRSLAEREQVTVFEILFSAFQTLLHRYTGSTDIVTGSPVPPGDVSNLIALRTDFSADPSFTELLSQFHLDLQEAHAHKDVPVERVIAMLGLQRSDSHPPLFQTTFQCEGLSVGRTEFDLGMDVAINSAKLTCTLNYSRDLFEAESIQRMLGHYRTILESVAANPNERVSRLPLLTPAERRRMLVEWNSTRAEYPQTCVHRLFEEQVQRTPDAVALVYGDRQLTYAELNREANRLAHVLRSFGVGPNVMVGISIERSLEMVVGLLASLKAGGAYAPLDPAYPDERLAFMLADLQAPVLLCRKQAGGLSEYTGAVLPVDEWPKITAAENPENPSSSVTPNDLAYVLYTSGSTGQPKGVLIPHRALVNYLTWCSDAYSAREGRGSPVHTPIGFDLTITSLFPPLLAGRCAVLVPEDSTLEGLTAALRSGNFSSVKLTPAHLEALSHRLSGEKYGAITRTFVIGGEALLGETLSFWRREFPAVRLINEYGPTEATVGCCVYEVPAGDVPPAAVPIGRPISNARLYVLDRNLQPVPIGVPGELHVAGDGLALGYHRRPQLTSERFIPDRFSAQPGAQLYKTGDLVRYRSDGNLEFLGRADDQVKIRGFRIELSEIENTLLAHAAVREAVVVASEIAPGDRRLIAYVVPAANTVLSEMQLRSFLREKLPEYMLPARFVFLNNLPLTSNGKIDRRALPPPDHRNETGGAPLETPRDQLEAQLVRIWEEVLRARPIGIKEDFFDLGGNSLLAIRMLSRVGKLLDLNISLATLLHASTIEQLAHVLRTPDALLHPGVFPLQPNGSGTPFFCVGAGPLFRLLAHETGSNQPFLGLPLPDVSMLPPPYRLEDIAAHCIQTMRDVQPEGPYKVGGWSDAGVIAYEMAQQLEQQGQKVALVVLFDAENPAYLANLPSALDTARVRCLFLGQWLKLQYRTLRSLGPRKLPEYVSQRAAFRLAWLKGKAWGVGYRIHLRSGWKLYHGLHNVEHVSAFAARSYRPRPYDGRVLLFRREQRPTGDYRDPEYGWGQLSSRLEIYDVPGNHMDMFLEPDVYAVADKLRACLLEAQMIGKATTAGANRS